MVIALLPSMRHQPRSGEQPPPTFLKDGVGAMDSVNVCTDAERFPMGS